MPCRTTTSSALLKLCILQELKRFFSFAALAASVNLTSYVADAGCFWWSTEATIDLVADVPRYKTVSGCASSKMKLT